MSFGNHLGAEISADDKVLLEKNLASLVIESTGNIENILIKEIGAVNSSNTLKINNLEYSIDNLLEAWTGTFKKLFPTEERKAEVVTFDESLNGTNKSSIEIISHKIAKPKVFIPLFPGTNCEYETLNAFRKEGADVNSIPLINLNNDKLNESLDAWVNEIDSAQILTFAGGFSAGDEPDGSAKFIVNVLKNEKIKSAVHRLLERDGLVLGICNGFQALVKSGLLPYGDIRDLDETSPTLTFNAIGRHISQMVNVKVLNDDSPWLKGMKGQIFTVPISHGEGRFYASEAELENLYKNGQIATQYVDLDGNIAYGMPHNPNASLFGIEGITSKSGKYMAEWGIQNVLQMAL